MERTGIASWFHSACTVHYHSFAWIAIASLRSIYSLSTANLQLTHSPSTFQPRVIQVPSVVHPQTVYSPCKVYLGKESHRLAGVDYIVVDLVEFGMEYIVVGEP